MFAIAGPRALYHRLVLNAVRYFTSERDGANVRPAVLHRRPANLTDRRAVVYADPRYDRNDNLLGRFHRIGGPVDVAGGWFDAGGGYEKFAYTASYSDALMMVAARDFPGRYPTLRPEAEFGLRWIGRLWSPRHKVMYVQVGIGNGNPLPAGQCLTTGTLLGRIAKSIPSLRDDSPQLPRWGRMSSARSPDFGGFGAAIYELR